MNWNSDLQQGTNQGVNVKEKRKGQSSFLEKSKLEKSVELYDIKQRACSLFKNDA